MNTLLLLDLDDTLLKNNIDAFLPEYLNAFSSFASDMINQERFIKSLMAGTQAMARNRQPDCTLKEVFDSIFFPLAGVKPEDFQPVVDMFYCDVFPGLRKLTEPIPEAKALVNEAVRRGYRLAITTNPLFPLVAIQQRLMWAKLPADQFPFELISSYETFHFAKPDPAYYAEVLGRLGWPDGSVIMIGDDLQRDIGPAGMLGLASYWVNHRKKRGPSNDHTEITGGPLEGVLNWIDESPEESRIPDYNSPEASIAILRSTPAVLDGLSRSIPESDLLVRPDDDEWSITEVFCHLRDVDEEVNLPRLKAVVETANPFLSGQDTDRWAESRNYCQQDGRKAFLDFMAARHQVVKLLESLAPEDWDRPARHAIFGPTTLQELVKIQAAHDRLHQQQVHRLVTNAAVS